jgi:hypothetical protein
MTGRDVLLGAFDTLFDAALQRLGASVTSEERDDARARFTERFSGVLDAVGALDVDGLPAEVLGTMKTSIQDLSAADLAGILASVPLAQPCHDMLRAVAVQQAQQRLLDQLAMQADTRWGGN